MAGSGEGVYEVGLVDAITDLAAQGSASRTFGHPAGHSSRAFVVRRSAHSIDRLA